jgi:hypothetical protein
VGRSCCTNVKEGRHQGSRKYNTIVLLVNLEIKELIDAGSTNK